MISDELAFAMRSANDLEGLLVGYEEQIHRELRRCSTLAEVIDAVRLKAKPTELEAVRVRWMEAKAKVAKLGAEYAERSAQQADVLRLIKKLER